MEVILLEKIYKLGTVGDIVKVKDGYGRNFLLPQKKALRATSKNKELFAEQKEQIEALNDKRKQEAILVAETIKNLEIQLPRQASEDGKLFGSVSARDITVAAMAKNPSISRLDIMLSSPIKFIGSYDVKVNLHPEVEVEIKVNVIRPEAE